MEFNRAKRLLSGVVALFLFAVMFAATGAQAQDGGGGDPCPPDNPGRPDNPGGGPPCEPPGGPYGSTTTTEPRGSRTTRCELLTVTVVPGGTVDSILYDVLAGDEIDIFVGDRLVSTVTVPTDEQAAPATADGDVVGLDTGDAVLFGVAAPTQTVVAEFPVTFTVPADMPAGEYLVEGVAPTYTCPCTQALVVVPAKGSPGSGDDDSKGLAFTGADIFMIVLVGLALIAFGVYLRRRFAEQRAHVG